MFKWLFTCFYWLFKLWKADKFISLSKSASDVDRWEFPNQLCSLVQFAVKWGLSLCSSYNSSCCWSISQTSQTEKLFFVFLFFLEIKYVTCHEQKKRVVIMQRCSTLTPTSLTHTFEQTLSLHHIYIRSANIYGTRTW